MKLRAKLSVFVLLALAMCSLLSSASGQSASAAWVDKSPHKSGFVQANGVQLHYLDWGGHGETLLFLAGLGHSAHVFDDLAQKFTNHFRVLAMTRRGFGLSDKPESGYDVETRVADLLGFLDALHIQRVTLAGHSIAGDELTAFAAAYPQRVDKLIYLDAAFDRSNNPIAKAVREGKAQPPPPPSIPKEALASVDAYRTFQQKRLAPAWSPAMEASIRDSILVHPDGTVERRAPDRVYNAIQKGSMLATLDYASVKPPTLSLYEDPSAFPDPEAQKYLMDTIALIKKSGPQIQTEVIHGAGHYLFIDHLDEVAAKMNAFLAVK